VGGNHPTCQRRQQFKKIKPLGGYSAHWVVAQLAYEFKISPRELMELEPRMLWTMQRYLVAVSRSRAEGGQ
jgi:hypothetical protein